MNESNVALTTMDNPYNPFTQFKEWLSYDIQMGYFTCELLARTVKNIPHALTDEENNFFIEEAIDEILKDEYVSRQGKQIDYIKVYEKDFDPNKLKVNNTNK